MLARGYSNFLEKQGRDSFSSGIRRLVFLAFLLPQKRKFHVQNVDEAVQSWMRSFRLDSRGSNRRQRHVNAIAKTKKLQSQHEQAKKRVFHHFFFLFLCPSSCLSGRCIGIPEAVCRLDPSCFPTRCLLGNWFYYYASSPTPPAPPTSSIYYLPVFDLPQPEKTSTESVCQSPANDATVVPPPQ